MKLSEELEWRGFVNQTTYKDLSALDGKPISFYWGVDPSANSMTIGNLAAAMMVRHFIDHGHKAFLLIGGATGMIGDPDGKKQERDLLSLETIAHNKAAISEEYRKVFAGKQFTIVDNYEWFEKMGYLEFLRGVGKHVPMRQMLGRDFVQSRLGEEGAGISYAEFSYSLIQGYDFLHLFRENGVTLQVCGADQWGNSITGVDLIRRIEGKEAHVYSVPIIVNQATGVKFGKSEGGAIWLDGTKTTPYKFYQFWINCDDEGIESYLKVYTLLSKEEVISLMGQQRGDPGSRHAQKRLAYEVTKLVHGEDQANKQKRIAEAVVEQQPGQLNDAEYATLREEMPHCSASPGHEIADLLVGTGLAGSKTEARRFVAENAIYLNGRQSQRERLDEGDFQNHRLFIRRGKAFKDSVLVERG
jgi:tyrosyl-tRNA synthetase